MRKRQAHGNAGHLAQQVAACPFKVSAVLGSLPRRQYHFAHSDELINLPDCIGIPRMLILKMHLPSGQNGLKMLRTWMQDQMERGERQTAN
jgi:hypothetical protein